MIKTLKKMVIEGIYLNIVKATYDKPTANIILNDQKLKAFSPKIRNKIRVSTFTIIIQHSSGSPSYSNQRRKIKGTQIRKEAAKHSLFANDTILYIKNSKEYQKITRANQ